MRTLRSRAFFLAIAATALGGCGQSQEHVSQPVAEGFNREWAEVAQLRAQEAEAAAVVPLLVRCLDDEQRRRLEAARRIGEYGPEARGAVPAIRRHLRGSAQNYGQWPFACNLLTALGRIGPDARDSVPELLELLDTKAEHDRRLHAHVIGVLGLIGPDAKAAVPRLMRHVHPESPHHTGALAAVQKITGREFGDGDEGIQKAQSWWRDEGQGKPGPPATRDVPAVPASGASAPAKASRVDYPSVFREAHRSVEQWHVIHQHHLVSAIESLSDHGEGIAPFLIGLTESDRYRQRGWPFWALVCGALAKVGGEEGTKAMKNLKEDEKAYKHAREYAEKALAGEWPPDSANNRVERTR